MELAFENHRWFDLLRTFNPAELVAYMKTKSQADFGIAKLSDFGTKDYDYPIPFDEYKLNPDKMYQNPGYGRRAVGPNRCRSDRKKLIIPS